MVSPTLEVLIFLLTIFAHREYFHRRCVTVIGCTFNNRISRAAIRTICKPIVKASILRILYIPQARLARCHIGTNESIAFHSLRYNNRKRVQRLYYGWFYTQGINASMDRQISLQSFNKSLTILISTLYMYLYTGRVISHCAYYS